MLVYWYKKLQGMVLPRYPSAPSAVVIPSSKWKKHFVQWGLSPWGNGPWTETLQCSPKYPELVTWNEQEEKMNSFSTIANTHDACVYIYILYNYI